MPTMRQKIERSRANARAALDAYRSTGGQDSEDLSAIADLIADLCHLAEHVAQDGDEAPDLVTFRALDHYAYECDPANADEQV
jgi:hypothetical protein